MINLAAAIAWSRETSCLRVPCNPCPSAGKKFRASRAGLDFSFDPLPAVEPFSAKDITFVFAGVDRTNSIDELTFKLEAFQNREKK
jgi:hypothetical protein